MTQPLGAGAGAIDAAAVVAALTPPGVTLTRWTLVLVAWRRET